VVTLTEPGTTSETNFQTRPPSETEFTPKIMVALDNYPGIKVEVVVNGNALQEHRDPEPEDGHVSRYIEVAAGDPYAVTLTVEGGYSHFKALLGSAAMSFVVEVDGNRIRSILMGKQEFSSRGTLREAVDALKTPRGPIRQKRPLIFANNVLGISAFKSFCRFIR
jgi:hypothetical protein